tara:strand:- start:28 stop:411 length:384 start_codon:yes stop_codon:yes gene_type:complete
LLDTLEDKNNLIALVGASNDPTKYGNKILLDLVKKGYNVAPVNTKEDTIAGIKSYKNILDLKESPSIINFVVPPSIGFQVTKELVENKFDNFWYQPGAESEKISYFLNENNKNFIDDKCIMVVTRLN